MINPIGHFRVWRELFTKPIWLKSTLEQKVILITLMSMVNFKAKDWEWEGEKFSLQPGQCITSIESIRMNTNGQVSTQNVRTALKRFEKLGFLTNESTKTGRLITLVNWRDYQYVEDEANIDTNKDLTKSQQRPNKELTTREEGNKEKKEKKEKEIDDFFEEIWVRYPKKNGKKFVSKEQKKKLFNIGKEDLIKAIDNYIAEIKIKNTEKQYIKNGSTFFNSGYIDYLPDSEYMENSGLKFTKDEAKNKEQIPTLLAMEMDGEFY